MTTAEQKIQKSASREARASFRWDDPLRFDDQLTEDERLIRDTARSYAQDRLLPRVIDAYMEEKTDRAIFTEMGALGLLGVTIPEAYGGAAAGDVSYGLVAREEGERVDSGFRSVMSVQRFVGYTAVSVGRQQPREQANATRRERDRVQFGDTEIAPCALDEPLLRGRPHAHPAPLRRVGAVP